ncbi:SAF domain-containing protein, partial [Micromonospora sp. WMMD736]|uniref:SAF domain-containing protein n=1 Tax=Micromonospora sp. WMMD736 TaxID=3404112 RepID=UPI003B934761
VAARRLAAAALVVLAGVAALRSDPQGERSAIVVAAHDLSPGIELTAADLRVETRLTATVPDGAATDPQPLVGSTLAGPTRRGEVITDVRVLGPRLAEAARGPNARVVPLHLSDTALVDLIRPGDVVDVLAAPDSETTHQPQLLAAEAVVVLVSERKAGPGAGSDRVVLVALPAADAHQVAAAALVQAVTLSFH